jgi:hypothetical protein
MGKRERAREKSWGGPATCNKNDTFLVVVVVVVRRQIVSAK